MPGIPHNLAELLDYLDETRAQLLQTLDAVNPSFAALKPRGGAWSVTEIVEHLARVEAGAARLVERSLEWAGANGVSGPPPERSFMDGLDSFDLIERADKRTAPEIVMPIDGAPLEASVRSLRESRERLRNAMLSGADLDLSNVTRKHAAIGEIDMYQWTLFVAQHEERHRRQIERTLAEVTELAAESAPIV